MLRHRVIPLVLLDGYAVVKTIKFEVRRNLGNPIVVSRVYNSRNVDELVLLDIDASKEGREIDYHTVNAVSAECFMPLTVGGGLRSIEHIAQTLAAGADKVSLNSIIFEDKGFLKKAVSIFGSQCITASIDMKKDESSKNTLYSHSGKLVNFSLDEILELLISSKVGEILLNSVDLDGVMTGYDYDLVRYISAATNLPIIVAGGASCPEDCVKVIRAGAAAASAASIFHFTSYTPRLCKEVMAKEGIPVRL